MLKTTLSHSVLAIAALTAACVAYSPSAKALPGVSRCSNSTLVGDFGYSAEGVLMGVPGQPPVTFRSVGTAHFDGRGNGSWVEHTVIDGVSLEVGWTSATVAYKVNANCTGLLVADTPNSPVPLNLYLTIVKGGSEFRTVLDNSAISAVFTRVQ